MLIWSPSSHVLSCVQWKVYISPVSLTINRRNNFTSIWLWPLVQYIAVLIDWMITMIYLFLLFIDLFSTVSSVRSGVNRRSGSSWWSLLAIGLALAASPSAAAAAASCWWTSLSRAGWVCVVSPSVRSRRVLLQLLCEELLSGFEQFSKLHSYTYHNL